MKREKLDRSRLREVHIYVLEEDYEAWKRYKARYPNGTKAFHDFSGIVENRSPVTFK